MEARIYNIELYSGGLEESVGPDGFDDASAKYIFELLHLPDVCEAVNNERAV